AHACDAIGKNPEVESKIRSTMILGIALSETCAIYGLLVAILLMFVYPNL
ncbi:MAG TPA: F0F1 ATP synthase subunit C, partial [Erysipelotrichaceae bacterium]|nr:F0F1 ATP synthase subunit C [Erysipelotrichaceae bacterium]